jgi:transketolase
MKTAAVNYAALSAKARQLRRRILEAIVAAGKGHIGGAYSCLDILVALYHGKILQVAPTNPAWPGRDRFILSKGHSGVALYAVLSDLGFFKVGELDALCHNGGRLGEHPDHRIPGVEIDTGSLGHGLSVGAGIALGAKLDRRAYFTFVLLGDGECYEGTVWEAALFAAHYRLNNLVAIVDRNRQITLDYTEECIRLEPFAAKWRAFGWETAVINGHSFPALLKTLAKARRRRAPKPLVIIAETIKGKGVSFMERAVKWHHGLPNAGEIEQARRELSGS